MGRQPVPRYGWPRHPIAALGLVFKRNFKSRPAGHIIPLVESIGGFRRWRLLASQVLQVSPIVNILQACPSGKFAAIAWCQSTPVPAKIAAMPHDDAELSDVIVVLVDEPGMTTQDAAKKLAELGLMVTDVDEANGVVEGTIETAKIAQLKKLEFVKYVRDVFDYVADYPPGDPRNLDSAEDDLPSETDDAGA